MRGIESSAARKIGERIAAARTRAGATRLDLAYQARVDPTNLGRYETGKALPNLGTLVRLADTLGIDPASLIEGLTFADFPAGPGHPAATAGPLGASSRLTRPPPASAYP